MCDPTGQSPITYLLRDIAGAPSRVAPERIGELRHLMENRLNLTIEFHWDNDGQPPLFIDYDTRTIRFFLPLAERLWACCYGYTQILNHLDVATPRVANLAANAVMDNARRLLAWVYFSRSSDWPVGLPRPVEDPRQDPALFEATEAFLCMCGWLLLHEIGHAARGHGASRARTNEEFERREYEADDFASNWVLERWRDYSGDEWVFVKRALGGLFALSVVASYEVYDRRYGDFEHPDPVERLLHYLRDYCPEGTAPEPTMTDYAWTAATLILQLHLEQAGKSIPPQNYSSFEELFAAASRQMG